MKQLHRIPPQSRREPDQDRQTSFAKQLLHRLSVQFKEFFLSLLKITHPLQHADITIDWHSFAVDQCCASVQTFKDILRCIDKLRSGLNERFAVGSASTNKHIGIS